MRPFAFARFHGILGAMVLAGVTAVTTPTFAEPAPSGPDSLPSDAQVPSEDQLVGGTVVLASFEPADTDATALTYDEELVPAGASAKIVSAPTLHLGTVTVLAVTGLQPNREYGAHAHVDPCGPDGDDAGPHFQHVPDPEQPSTDPAYANPTNEIWLDFTTDATGTGVAVSTVPWVFTDRRAGSVVVHEHHTHTDPGEAGVAGARAGCVTVDF